MAASAIVKLVTSRLAYTQMKAQGPMQQDIEIASKEALASICECIRKVPAINVCEASTLQSLVSDSILPEQAKRDALNAMDAKVNLVTTLEVSAAPNKKS